MTAFADLENDPEGIIILLSEAVTQVHAATDTTRSIGQGKALVAIGESLVAIATILEEQMITMNVRLQAIEQAIKNRG